MLRHDNADQRLMRYGHELGLISEERYARYKQKLKDIEDTKAYLETVRFTPKSEINMFLKANGYDELKEGVSARELLKRPNVTMYMLMPYLDRKVDAEVSRQLEIDIKYEGYILKAKRDAKHLRDMDNVVLPTDICYDEVANLSLEARQKLAKVMPLTMGQASRISGVNPADIAVLAVYLEQRKRKA